MENFEQFIFIVGGLAIAFAFGWTATCKLLIPVMAWASKKINAMEGRAGVSRRSAPLPDATTGDELAGPDADIGLPDGDRRPARVRGGSAVVIELHRWKAGAASPASARGPQSRKVPDRKTSAGVRRI
jgi:hypothetical protein